MTLYKQTIIVRTDLGMSPGKVAAQVGHGVLGFLNKGQPFDDAYINWRATGSTKVILSCSSEEELRAMYEQALARGLYAYLVVDEGRTEIPPNTATVLAIGPDNANSIAPVTQHLRLYR